MYSTTDYIHECQPTFDEYLRLTEDDGDGFGSELFWEHVDQSRP